VNPLVIVVKGPRGATVGGKLCVEGSEETVATKDDKAPVQWQK
jgi:hypothetical protein